MKKYLKITFIFLLMTFLVTTGQSCTKGGTQEAQDAMVPVTLKIWGVYDESDAYREIMDDYRAVHPNVSIEYRKLRYEEYEEELLEAFALGEGPDIFMVHNTWMNKYQKLMEPMPAVVRVPYKRIVGTVKKEEVVELVTNKLYTPTQITAMYGDTVAMDAVLDYNEGTEDEPVITQRAFGLPLSLDTLALYYNKDILNNSGIPLPAIYWNDVQAQVESIRKVDEDGNILVAAIPLGTAKNITRSFDILSLLMMQLKTEMVNDRNNPTFDLMPAELKGQTGITEPPGYNALNFYTSFANPLLTSYTWNDTLPESLNTFINGQSAYFVGYSYHRPVIDAQAPKLNYAIAPMLQVQGYDQVNYANYWFHSVSNKSANKSWAWDFVRFMNTEEEAIKYLTETKKPAALRSLYDEQIADEDLAVFVEQTLTAQSWYRGYDSNAAEDIFANLIDGKNEGTMEIDDLMELAVKQIQQTMREE